MEFSLVIHYLYSLHRKKTKLMTNINQYYIYILLETCKMTCAYIHHENRAAYNQTRVEIRR